MQKILYLEVSISTSIHTMQVSFLYIAIELPKRNICVVLTQRLMITFLSNKFLRQKKKRENSNITGKTNKLFDNFI